MRPVPKKELDEVLKMREAGATFADIGRRFGITKEGARHRLRLANGEALLTRTCELPDCDRVFMTTFARKRFCCHKHAKRAAERYRSGYSPRKIVCALPECSVTFWAGEEGSRSRRFCCKAHGARHANRIKKGWYERILGRGKTRCVAPGCKESVVLDQHHVQFEGRDTARPKRGPVVFLCPTHHAAVHRGLAVLTDEGNYTSLLPLIRRRLRAVGDTWEEAK